MCSVEMYTPGTNVVVARIHYDGVLQETFRAKLPRRGFWKWAIASGRVNNLPLPGGRWTCEFRLRSTRVAAAFSSDGPTGTLVNLAVCDIGTGAPVNREVIKLACAADASAQGIPARHYVSCNAMYLHTHQLEAMERVDLVFPNGAVVQGGSYRITAPVWLSWQWFGAINGLAPGTYTCRFLLDGLTMAEHRFVVHE